MYGKSRTYSRPKRLNGRRGYYLQVYDRRTQKKTWVKAGDTLGEATWFRDELYLGRARLPSPIDETESLTAPVVESVPRPEETKDARTEPDTPSGASESKPADLPW